MTNKKKNIYNNFLVKYRNFQKQISDHLASLKSNAQVIDMKKMMEAIIQQSQIFCHDDLDSVVMEENLKNLSKPNGLMHSSPTTTKTSDVNSSWKRISSIKNHEPLLNLSKSNEKEFYQVYGDISDFESSENSFKKHKEKLVAAEENLDSSFTSCLSINNEENALSGLKTKSTCEDKEVCEVGKKMESTSSSQKLKSSIDELLKNMKLKWSEEIYGTSPENDTIDDFLNGSRLSSISD